VSSGGFVVGAVRQHSASQLGFGVTSITDDKNNPYTLVDSVTPPNDVNGTQLATFYGGPFTNGPTTITVTGSGGPGQGQRWRVALAEFAGISGTIDGHAMQGQSAPGNGPNAITSGSISTSANGDLIYSAFLFYGGTSPATLAPGVGFTLLDDGSPAIDGAPMGQEYLVQKGPPRIAGTWSQTGSGAETVAGVMAFKASGTISLAQHVLGPDATTTASASFSQAFAGTVTSGSRGRHGVSA